MQQKLLENKEWTVQEILGDVYPTTPSLYTVGFILIAINLPKEKFKNEHMLQGFFLGEYRMSLWG